ncbi:RNA-binding S4 domain-containing protein [Mycoplasmopsis primatum]|uniref:RNA-binding S4 domain-containing protein n=1 Tax=Mycoplasmopsis primatum TaxID=55604 RepID=UPI0004977616|nr:RNA-binding S4 domain-containing protein [Mycoplasmopsis primatum]
MSYKIYIKENFITIGKLIKKTGFTQTGGASKYFLKNNKILINNQIPQGRNTKVFNGDIVWINDNVFMIQTKEN